MLDIEKILGNKKSSSRVKSKDDSILSLFSSGHNPGLASDFMIRPSRKTNSRLVTNTKPSTSNLSSLFNMSSPNKASSKSSDYLLNGCCSKKSSASGLSSLFNMSPSKKSPSKSTFNVDANVILNGRPSKTQRPLGSFLGDRVTKKQRAFLNKTRLGSGKSHLRFFDHDGDGVMSGLDCAPFDPTKHGFFGSLASAVKSKLQDVKDSYKETKKKIGEGVEHVVDETGERIRKGLHIPTETERTKIEFDKAKA